MFKGEEVKWSIIVETEIGHTNGRDAIHVDMITQKGNSLFLKGEISGRQCSNNYENCDWYSYELVFENVMVYQREDIDISLEKWNTKNNFAEIKNSEWIKEYGLCSDKYKHYILETHDDVYSVICQDYSFTVTAIHDEQVL